MIWVLNLPLLPGFRCFLIWLSDEVIPKLLERRIESLWPSVIFPWHCFLNETTCLLTLIKVQTLTLVPCDLPSLLDLDIEPWFNWTFFNTDTSDILPRDVIVVRVVQYVVRIILPLHSERFDLHGSVWFYIAYLRLVPRRYRKLRPSYFEFFAINTLIVTELLLCQRLLRLSLLIWTSFFLTWWVLRRFSVFNCWFSSSTDHTFLWNVADSGHVDC